MIPALLPDTICYDDVCHLKEFAQNPRRSKLTATSKKMSEMNMVCDQFQFKIKTMLNLGTRNTANHTRVEI